MAWSDRWGWPIVLPEAIWFDKILINHDEMIGNEDAVERTLADPDEARTDRDDDDRESFYRRGVLPIPDHRRYLKVVVVFRQQLRENARDV